jgi:hypothetical protein
MEVSTGYLLFDFYSAIIAYWNNQTVINLKNDNRPPFKIA